MMQSVAGSPPPIRCSPPPLPLPSRSFFAVATAGTGQKIPKQQVEAMMREVDVLRAINHPKIVKYLGFSQVREGVWVGAGGSVGGGTNRGGDGERF